MHGSPYHRSKSVPIHIQQRTLRIPYRDIDLFFRQQPLNGRGVETIHTKSDDPAQQIPPVVYGYPRNAAQRLPEQSRQLLHPSRDPVEPQR